MNKPSKQYTASITKLYKQYIKTQKVIMKYIEKVNSVKTKKAKRNNMDKSIENLVALKNIQNTLLDKMDDSLESAEIQESIMESTTDLEHIIFAKDDELTGFKLPVKLPKSKSTKQSKPSVINVNDFIKAIPKIPDRPSLYEPKNTDEYDNEIHFNQVPYEPKIKAQTPKIVASKMVAPKKISAPKIVAPKKQKKQHIYKPIIVDDTPPVLAETEDDVYRDMLINPHGIDNLELLAKKLSTSFIIAKLKRNGIISKSKNREKLIKLLLENI